MPFKLREGESILTAWAERASGPGWANFPIYVLVRTLEGALRLECLQPQEQTFEMLWLYKVSEAAHQSMVGAIKGGFNAKTRKKV